MNLLIKYVSFILKDLFDSKGDLVKKIGIGVICHRVLLLFLYLFKHANIICEKVQVAQSCLTLCNPMSIPWTFHTVHGILQARILELGSLSLLQGISPTQGSNPHYRRILYQLSHKESPRILEWVTYPFFSGSSPPRNWTKVSCIAGGFFTNWAVLSVLEQYSRCHLPMQEMQVCSLGQEYLLEEEMAIHFSILAWKIPWTKEPGGLQSMELQRIGHDWATQHAYML